MRPPRYSGNRSTPTHVGNTCFVLKNSRAGLVHPHARGEYLLPPVLRLPAVGPPPRTWGIRRRARYEHFPCRSTPTHVGNTPGPQCKFRLTSVHPHARGEYVSPGTSPFPTASRSTPTHVGNTSGRNYDKAQRSVHPHARGEYLRPASMRGSPTGPPPRTWGILVVYPDEGSVCRSTPTHVGNTTWLAGSKITFPVHPHARGEYASWTA